MSKSSTPLTIVYTPDVTIVDKTDLEAKGHVMLPWDLYLDIRERPSVHLFLGAPFYNWKGEITLKQINIMTKAEREAITAAKREAKVLAKAEKAGKQITLSL